MIIGRGDIANELWAIDKPMVTFFASGVSNSKEQNEEEYQREIDLLLLQPKNQHLIYFSSLCIYYSQSRYAQHKVKIENIIRENFSCYTIVRLGNIAWGKNKSTIINHFKWLFYNDREPDLHDTYRYVVSLHEFAHWMKLIPIGTKSEMNIPGEFIHVNEIWRRVQDGKY